MKYTDEQLTFLHDGYQHMTIVELAKAFNDRFCLMQQRSAIGSMIKREGITRDRRRLIGKSLTFSPEQIQFIRKEYRHLPLKELAAAFIDCFGPVKNWRQIRCFVKNQGITCDRTGCFEKGQKSWNKGVKGYMGPNATSFRKGNVPANRKPIGTERLTKDGYIEVKIAERNPYTGSPTRYKQKHVVLWESLHGPVPKGMCVIFRNGNRPDCIDENLMLVNRKELLRLNHYRYKGISKDLKPSVMALARLEVTTFQREKEAYQGKRL